MDSTGANRGKSSARSPGVVGTAANNQKALGALRGFAAKSKKVGIADLPLDAR